MAKSYDPRMHSAEHILNQTMIRMFDCGRCVSAHIEKKKSKCDYAFQRELKPEEVAEIERRVNAVIEADVPILEEYLSHEEASRALDLRRLPEDAGERIRVITIGDYDICPCIGEHVDRSGEIGNFRITSTDWNQGMLRIRYRLKSR